MRSFFINPTTGDLDLDGQNNIRMIEGDDELVQCVMIAMRTNKGEWFLNPDHGFNRSVVQTKRYDEAMVSDEVYEAVLQEDRIVTIDELKFDYDRQTRQLKVDFKFSKEDGEMVEGVVD